MKTISRIPVFNCVEPSGWQLRALPSGCENCLLFIAEEWLTGDQRQNEEEMPSAVTSLKAMTTKAAFYKRSPKTPSSMLELLKSGVWLKMLFKLGVVAGTRDFSTLRTRQGICLFLSPSDLYCIWGQPLLWWDSAHTQVRQAETKETLGKETNEETWHLLQSRRTRIWLSEPIVGG